MESLLELLQKEKDLIVEVFQLEKQVEYYKRTTQLVPNCISEKTELQNAQKRLENVKMELETFRKEVIGKQLSEYYGVKVKEV